MPYEAKNFEGLIGMTGFSEKLLRDHFTLYQGYVTNFNKLNEILKGFLPPHSGGQENLHGERSRTMKGMEKEGKFGTPEYAELNRRLGWEFNGMRLHELYFGNMSTAPKAFVPESALGQAIIKEFGSYAMWETDFKAMGAMRGIGWVILYYDKNHNKAQTDADSTQKDAEQGGRLFNVWVNEHDVGHFAGATPLAVMDVFEHAYIADYGIKRKDYIEKFMANLDWAAIEQRFMPPMR